MEFEKLCEVRNAYKEGRQLHGKIMEFEAMRISPRVAVYGAERVQTSPKGGDIQVDNVVKIDELLERYNAQLRICLALTQEFEQCINERLNSRERRIMRRYFIDCLTWEQISVEEGITWRSLHRIRKKAVEKITA